MVAVALPRVLAVLGACLGLSAVSAKRVKFGLSSKFQVDVNRRKENHCCCRAGQCIAQDLGEGHVTYSPNHNLCCKTMPRTCGHVLHLFSRYKVTPPSPEYCSVAQDQRFAPPPEAPTSAPPVPPGSYEPGSAGHTIHTYCNFSRHVDNLGGDENEATKRKIVKQVVDQLDSNSLDSMAKEIFTLYMCVRWVPSQEFKTIGEGEVATQQLEDKSVFKHFEESSFIPLKCTENFNVYGNKISENQTNFQHFEAQMQSQQTWYAAEQSGAITSRLRSIFDAKDKGRQSTVEELSKAFDLNDVKARARSCASTESMKVNVFTASATDLLNDCAASKWWLGKLQDWHRSMPFSTFMAPKSDLPRAALPTRDEQVMVCFGKRVASQLHRRKQGDHLMTDQVTVGCHGFWSFTQAAQMIDRIVKLWRPPTCQLAAMELEMKIKIMEMVVDMNNRLFDALPSMLVEEQSGLEDWDGKPLEVAGTVGLLAGIWTSIVDRFQALRGSYERLGTLLGGTPVKWAVCPLNTITNQTELDKLDDALGHSDDLSQWYQQQAYAKFTGKDGVLPGEVCNLTVQDMPRVRGCDLGIMREDMPEAYPGVEFVCPIRPLLPGKAQLDVFKHKTGQCLLSMTTAQLQSRDWIYKGHNPSTKQYDVKANAPTTDLQAIKYVKERRRPDTVFGVWRDWMTVSTGCTEEENVATPRWCATPVILNPDTSSWNLLTGIALPIPGLGSSTGGASLERLGTWFKAQFAGLAKSTSAATQRWFGEAEKREQRLQARRFKEVEAAELLHSATFQRELEDDGSDSKGHRRYTRYAAVTECPEHDAEKAFEMEYKWHETALQLARQGNLKFREVNGQSLTGTRGAFKVQVRSEAMLHARHENSSWLTYFTHFRAAPLGEQMPQYIRTNDAFLTSFAGNHDLINVAKVQPSDVIGVEATFTCGERHKVHNLPLDDLEAQHPESIAGIASWADCVKFGKANNPEWRQTNPSGSPGSTYVPREFVVRVTFRELDSCHIATDPTKLTELEKGNPVVKNFQEMAGCSPTLPDLPDDLKNEQTKETYRGFLLGNSAPKNTLKELLMDPADFAYELGIE